MLTIHMIPMIEEKYEMTEQQQGFGKNRSMLDTIYKIRQLTEKAIEFNKQL